MKNSKTTIILLFASLILLALPTLTLANEQLFSAEYKGKHGRFAVKTVRTLSLDTDGNYRFHSLAKSRFASIEENSIFKTTNGKLMPLKYQYERSIFGLKKTETIDFDWEKGTAVFDRSDKADKRTTHNVNVGILDPSLYQLQIQRDLFSGTKTLSYDFVRDDRIKNYTFKVVGEETLELIGKPRKAVKIERRNDNDEKRTIVWLVPEFNFQIGKIRHVDEDGDSYEIQITKYTSQPQVIGTIYLKASN